MQDMPLFLLTPSTAHTISQDNYVAGIQNLLSKERGLRTRKLWLAGKFDKFLTENIFQRFQLLKILSRISIKLCYVFYFFLLSTKA